MVIHMSHGTASLYNRYLKDCNDEWISESVNPLPYVTAHQLIHGHVTELSSKCHMKSSHEKMTYVSDITNKQEQGRTHWCELCGLFDIGFVSTRRFRILLLFSYSSIQSVFNSNQDDALLLSRLCPSCGRDGAFRCDHLPTSSHDQKKDVQLHIWKCDSSKITIWVEGLFDLKWRTIADMDRSHSSS